MAKERFFNLPVLILIASSFMLGMSEFIMVGILPDIAVGLKVSEVTVGNLVSLFAFVYAPVTPLGSALSARFPRFATHMTLIGVFLAGNLLCAFAPNYAVLMAGRILIALVSGTLVAIAMTYAPDVTTDTFRTKFIAWVFSGFSIASVVGVPVGTWVANAFGWRWAFHLVNALTVVLIIGMVAVLPRNSHIVKIGFLPQFRLFFDRRIQLGVLDVVFGAFSVRRRRLEYAGALHFRTVQRCSIAGNHCGNDDLERFGVCFFSRSVGRVLRSHERRRCDDRMVGCDAHAMCDIRWSDGIKHACRYDDT